jgi:TRAP-type C4-dicarboxylate transport system permease small subunit
MNLVYGACLIGFACSALRAVQVALENWRRGYSVLDPAAVPADGEGTP